MSANKIELLEASEQCAANGIPDCVRCLIPADVAGRVTDPVRKPNLLKVCQSMSWRWCPSGKRSTGTLVEVVKGMRRIK